MDEGLKTMFEAATAVSERAYAPYSQFRVGCCIRGENGKLYVGCNAENAAYGLTQCAEASAIGQMIADGCTRLDQVVIVQADGKACPPCGACRQRLWEHHCPNTQVHFPMGDPSVTKTSALGQLLPETFTL